MAPRSDQGDFDIRADNLYAAPVMAADIQASYSDQQLMVVSPDVGGVVRARALAKRLDKAPLAIVDSFGRVLPWEVLDTYVSPPASADGLDPDMVANLEPRLRNLECDKPHKLGGQIDTVYGDPLKKGHIQLFQFASDAATGWICGDLGLVYVSIDAAQMEAGNFDKVRAWLEA